MNSESPARCRIHRGCHEIGGNCVELEVEGVRIVLDVGLPLNENTVPTLPHVSGFRAPDSSLLGILISHPHPDHFGFLEQIAERVPVYMGEAAQRIIKVSDFFTPLPGLGDVEPNSLKAGVTIELGLFRVTPFEIDHSAFDSHCLLIEVSGRRLLYSGDIRAHGRRSHLFDDFVNNPPEDIDVLICEGTQIGREPDFEFPDETSVTNSMADVFNETKGMGLVWCSSQNIDRVVSVYEAAKKAGRRMIIDMYTAEILRTSEAEGVPIPGQDSVTVFLPKSQKARIKREKAFHIPRPYYDHRIYPEDLAEVAAESVMLFRPSMLNDLKLAECVDGASFITSVWSGYLPREEALLAEFKSMGVEHHHIHTSGHATVPELRRFVDAFPSARVVPIHLEDREGFQELSTKVELHDDGEWWEV